MRHLPPVSAASSGTLIFPHPQVTGEVFQSFDVVAFQKVGAGEGAVDCRGGLGLVGGGPRRIGRGLLQDREGQFRTKVAPPAALFDHRF